MDNCTIIKQLVNVEKQTYSLVQKETYVTYYSCNPEVTTAKWVEYNLNNWPWGIFILVLCIMLMFLMYFDDKRNGR